ncbi:ATP-binding protein [Virgisporangium ochraceum]|uniref:HTH cro/C1-type domain-containing protein n=1 Tax=Virgisporangium ochraceum TaxID=65505 RepID=A0A8J3ZV75_9ACTN|nr:helix-turn-helix domain-containing protein [Virgisporangium ochraceum]GIJ70787.1 hypothetical protein Voc01_057040 [Virgisporangium ochraceum]
MQAAAEPGDFAVALRRLREARSLTQEELAERAGLTAKAVGALERGERRRPYPHTVRSLADGLGLGDDDRAALVAAVPHRSTTVARGETTVARGETTVTAGETAVVGPAGATAGRAGAVPDVTPLIGRDGEVAELLDLIGPGARRLVTVTGPGGVGKTRLAMRVLRLAAPDFPGGAHPVDLSAVREPKLVMPAVAAALGLPDTVGVEPLDALVPHLAGLRVLLVLDNLEQLTAAAPVLADLLARCPDLVVVATSRAPLRIRAEHELVLGPLPTPVTDDVDAVAASPAVALLLDRAAAAGSPTVVTDDDAPALAAIVRRLDGLPLAVELAAPGLRLLSPWALLARLERSAPGGGPRDLPERHRTMAAVLDWSMDLLEPEEVSLFERLAVFSGGFTLDAAEAVTADDALPALATLLDQSLLLRAPSPDRQPRFRLLEPVRQYAMRRLHASGQATTAADRHAAYFHALATASKEPLEGPELAGVLDRLDADHGNLRSAYLRLLELDRDSDAAELAGSVWLYLALRGHAREGLTWLARIGPGASDAARCRALTGRLGLGLLAGDSASMRGDADAAVAAAGRVTDPVVTCETLTLAGQSAVFAGALDDAGDLLARALAQAEAAGRPWVAVHARLAQGQLALVAGDLATAGRVLPEAVRSARRIGNPFTLATALNVHATLTELLGDEPATAALLGEAVTLSLAVRMSWTLGYALPALASLAQRAGDPASAAWLFGAGASISAADAVDPTFPVARALSDRGLDATRAALGEPRFTREWDAGRAAGAAGIQARAAAVTTRAGGDHDVRRRRA